MATGPDDQKTCTTNGQPVDEVRAKQTAETGQHEAYIVLCEEDRKKGFVRPVRDRYKHVGIAGPTHALRDLSDEERERYASSAYVKFEAYTERESPVSGRFWTQAQLDAINTGCGSMTTMGRSIAETYARDPHFYGSTFCVTCNRHLPVGEHGEFVWLDGSRVGS